uniref:La-related protein 7 n=3 Tax=Cacopsylla melanoneura TaxID=428564 RepID=A0A8D9EY10_9HEMI
MSEDMESTTDKDLSDQRNKDSSGGRHRKKQLFQQIMQLMEFYLSDSNLRKDRFFNQLLQDSPEIDLSVFLKCNKLARLTTDPDDIVKALKKSKLLEVTEDGTKVKRTVQVQDKPDVDECTIYVEKLPPDVEHDYIEKVFTKFGKVTYVSLPKFKATGKLKGFAFVEFSCKEEAEKALEAYTELGCRLPSTMAPEALISIQTFEGEKSNVENRLLRPQSAPEPIEELENQPKEQTPDEVPEETKGNVSESSPPQKRRKTGNEGSDEDMSKGDESKDEHEPSSAPEIVGKKKKSRKKKKKTLDTSPESSGMLVLSKIEWKKLRNQYLNLQRIKMKKLKTHLQTIKRTQWTHPHLIEQEKKKEEEAAKSKEDGGGDVKDKDGNKASIEFVPGVIVRVHLEEPLVDVKVFKSELRHKPNVKYIDAQEGAQDAFVRCINPEEAKNLAESKVFPQCDILKGEEEVLYWEKIDYDRKVKFSMKTKTCRGRNKLLKKAEKALGKHIRFDSMEV